MIGHPNGSRSPRFTYGAGDFPIGTGFAIRNRLQFVPHCLLELRPLKVERKVEHRSFSGKVFLQLLDRRPVNGFINEPFRRNCIAEVNSRQSPFPWMQE